MGTTRKQRDAKRRLAAEKRKQELLSNPLPTPKKAVQPISEITPTILPKDAPKLEEVSEQKTILAKPTKRRKEIHGFLGSGILALIITFLTSAFQIAGVIDMEIAHFLIFLAWLVVVVGVLVSERLLEASGKRTLTTVALTAIIAGITLYCIDSWMVNKKAAIDKKAEIERIAAQPKPLPTLATQKTPDDQLARIEFRTESAKALKSVIVLVKFNRIYTPQEIGHFRLLFEITTYNADTSPASPALLLEGRDYYKSIPEDENKQIRFGNEFKIWSRNPNKESATGRIIRDFGVDSLDLGFDILETQMRPFKIVDDLNGKDLNVYVTESLLGKISEISLIANNYVLISAKVDQFLISNDKPNNWILPLSSAERKIQWRKVFLKPTGAMAREIERVGLNGMQAIWQLDFTLKTPTKFMDKSVFE